MVSVVIPTYNECENIVPLLECVAPLAEEVIVVDDNSVDGTGQMAMDFGGNVRVVIRPCKMGLSSAILRGFNEAREDDVIVMDADFSHPPSVVPEIAEALKTHDIVIASRDKIIGWGVRRHLVSKVATALAQILYFRGRINDPMSGFFGAKKSIVERYEDSVSPQGYKALFAIMRNYVHDYGYDGIASVNYTFINRKFGGSKLSMPEIMDYIRSLFKGKIPMPSLKIPIPLVQPSYTALDRIQSSGYCSFMMRIL